MVKVGIEPAALLGWVDIRRMLPQCATDSPKQYTSGFEFRVFPPPRPKLESPLDPTILPISGHTHTHVYRQKCVKHETQGHRHYHVINIYILSVIIY